MNTTTKTRFYLPELDGIRFFAFLLVFVHHHPLFSKIPILSKLHYYGWIGVDLFFGLSAYLFTKLLIAEFQKTNTINFKRFYIRRIFRIWPVYFLFVGIALTIYLINNPMSNRIAWRIFGLLTFTDNIFTAFDFYNPITMVPHLWTIAYEEQFYIFVPLLILSLIKFSKKSRWVLFISTLITFNVVRWYFIAQNIPHPAIYVLPITHFEAILLGIALGFGGLNFILKLAKKPEVLAWISLFLFIIICLLPNITIISYWLSLSYTLVGLSVTLLLLATLHSSTLKAFCAKNFLVFLGKRSYGLYLYHFVGNWVSWKLVNYFAITWNPTLVSFCLSLGITILLSIISYWFIETPFLRWKKKFEIVASRPI